jgi:O-succinylhomoserine sulfhydrylase
MHPQTLAIRSNQYYDVADSHCEPIAMTSAYTYESAAAAAARFTGRSQGNVYSRFTNPTVQAFEARAAAMEGAESGVAFASGMAAITGIGMAYLKQGDVVACSRDVFGSTLGAFRNYFGGFGVETRAVPLSNLAAWQAALDERVKLVFLESPSNPLLDVGDIARIAQMAHAVGALLVVDNTMLTPLQQRPLQLGADVVIQSAGKHMDGQGRCLGGLVTGSKDRIQPVRDTLRTLGASLSPMSAWLLLKGLETLDLRVERASRNAARLATWLEGLPGVLAVNHTSLPSHAAHQLAKRQQTGHGSVLSFRVAGGQEAAWQLIDSLRLISIATNIGDTRSMVTHPASTTHCRLTPEERLRAGITDDLVRISIGLEHEDDLMDDLEQALAACQGEYLDDRMVA